MKLYHIYLQVIFILIPIHALAGIVTKTHTYATPLSIDGTSDYGVPLTGINFVSGVDFPSTDEIGYVLISITFHKTDGTCGAPNSGSAYHSETTFRIDGPSGTNVILANSGTWTGNSDASTVNVI